jgi:hypothetical protein
VNRVLVIMGLGVTAFAVTLAVYISSHLSDEAISVLTGAACGVGAMLPAVSIGVISLLRRRDPGHATPASPWAQQGAQQPYPPVIVVAPPASSNALPAGQWQGMYPQGMNMPGGEREFSVIGEEEGVWNNERRSSW